MVVARFETGVRFGAEETDPFGEVERAMSSEDKGHYGPLVVLIGTQVFSFYEGPLFVATDRVDLVPFSCSFDFVQFGHVVEAQLSRGADNGHRDRGASAPTTPTTFGGPFGKGVHGLLGHVYESAAITVRASIRGKVLSTVVGAWAGTTLALVAPFPLSAASPRIALVGLVGSIRPIGSVPRRSLGSSPTAGGGGRRATAGAGAHHQVTLGVG